MAALANQAATQCPQTQIVLSGYRYFGLQPVLRDAKLTHLIVRVLK